MTYKKDKKTKDSEIKIRINKKDKEDIIRKAYQMNMNLSSYILKALEDSDKLQMIPDAVSTWQLCNDVFYAVKQSGDEQLIKTISNILCQYVRPDRITFERGSSK